MFLKKYMHEDMGIFMGCIHFAKQNQNAVLRGLKIWCLVSVPAQYAFQWSAVGFLHEN